MPPLNSIEIPNSREQQPESIEILITTRENIRSRREDYPFDIDDLNSTAEEVDYNPESDYTISPIDDKNKFTDGLANCTSLVVVGNERDTGRNISFQTHQSDPPAENMFYKELARILDEIKSRSSEGTVSVVITGGSAAHPVREKAYKVTTSLIAKTVREKIGIEPHFAVEPKVDAKNDELVYCDTQNRKIFIIR